MELRDLLGEDYREGMTAEEIATALSTKNFVNKETFDKTASDLAKAKKDMKANEGTLTERLEAQRQQIEQLTVKANRQEAASILAGNGMAKEAYHRSRHGYRGSVQGLWRSHREQGQGRTRRGCQSPLTGSGGNRHDQRSLRQAHLR